MFLYYSFYEKSLKVFSCGFTKLLDKSLKILRNRINYVHFMFGYNILYSGNFLIIWTFFLKK